MNRVCFFALFGLAVAGAIVGMIHLWPWSSSQEPRQSDTSHEGWSDEAIRAEKRYHDQQAFVQQWGREASAHQEQQAPIKWVEVPPEPAEVAGLVSPATTCMSFAFTRPRKRIVPDGLPVATAEDIAALKRLPIVDIDGITTEGDYVVGGVIVPAELLGPTTTRGPCW